ncbi:MAG: glycosyltransferase family 2 protein [Phycisphaera sp.]|nr:glycosyltransferase family 2 protein [Actinomycetales bacterium]MCP4834394.1 glycosyltransferase family 2 protein [Phycisphaera sp.]
MSRSDEIRFGIVIPAYKAATTIVATLDAVAAQSHSPISVVVVIDGPDPGLEELVSEHRLNCDVIVLPENTGAPGSPRNVGAASLCGRPDIEAIWFLDDDDIPAPDFLAIMDETLGSHPDAMFACSSFRDWNEASPREAREIQSAARPVSTEIELDWYLTNTGALLPSFSVIRVEALRLLDDHGGRFNPVLTHNQDYEVFVRLLHLVESRRVDWCGGDYRIRASSLSADTARAWSCRMQTDLILADWFDSKSNPKICQTFRRRSRSAARRAARERWHSGDRMTAAKSLLWRGIVGLDFKAMVVLVSLSLGFERPSARA